MPIIPDERPDCEPVPARRTSPRIRRPNRRAEARRLISASLARLAARRMAGRRAGWRFAVPAGLAVVAVLAVSPRCDRGGRGGVCVACGNPATRENPLVVSGEGWRVHRAHFEDPRSGFYGAAYTEVPEVPARRGAS